MPTDHEGQHGDREPAARAPEFPQGLAWLNVPAPLSLQQLRGQPVVVSFFNGGGITSLHHAEQVRRVHQSLHDRITVIGVHTPKFPGEAGLAAARETILRLGLEHPVVVDPAREAWNAWAARAWPTTMVIDPRGVVVARATGAMDAPRFAQALSKDLDTWQAEGVLRTVERATRLETAREHPHLLRYPSKLLLVSQAFLYVTDSGHHRVVELELNPQHTAEARVRRVFGSGERGLLDGAPEQARWDSPRGMALVGRRLMVADAGNHCVRAIDLDTGHVTTVAGTGEAGQQIVRSGHPLRTALRSPWALWWDRPRLYIALAGGHQLAWIESDELVPFLGHGREAWNDGPAPEAGFAQPSDLAGDGRGLYVVDAQSSAVRRINLIGRPSVETLVGAGLEHWGDEDGTGESVRLQHPTGLVYDGLLYASDTYNHKIKQMDPTSRRMTRLAGSGERGHADGRFVHAKFHAPDGLAVRDRTLYVADSGNHVLRVLDLRHLEVRTMVVHD